MKAAVTTRRTEPDLTLVRFLHFDAVGEIFCSVHTGGKFMRTLFYVGATLAAIVSLTSAAVAVRSAPAYLAENIDPGKFNDKLLNRESGPLQHADFSKGHFGAVLRTADHTQETYQAGARKAGTHMGAGIVECDVTFTKDGALVCRHAECDLHMTTNILTTPLNNRCSVPGSGSGSSPKCCTSDLTLAQFKTLKDKVDSSNPSATTVERFWGSAPSSRTDPHTGHGTLMTLKESIALNQRLGLRHTPELKAGNPDRIKAIFGSQANYAQKMLDEFKAARVNPQDVFPQSFNKDDILYWIQHEPRFGKQAVYLNDVDPSAKPQVRGLTLDELKNLKAQGVRIIAPPMFALLAVDVYGDIVPSQYARDIKALGFNIITWTLERADMQDGATLTGSYLFDPLGQAVKKDSDMYKALDVLARNVGILGIFSDWPATMTYDTARMVAR
jgi:glycerophosphoryl diester phosphodiesterase